jgi:hypothetical protein
MMRNLLRKLFEKKILVSTLYFENPLVKGNQRKVEVFGNFTKEPWKERY